MTRLTFYGGVEEIGGNKILLEDDGKNLFLDFGLSYSRRKQYYEEYLNPRGGTGLLDHLAMGLIPPLEGAYRPDLEPENLWQAFKGHPLYRKIEHIDGVLLTHAHFDHSGNICFLNSDIPIYSTATTAFLTKAIQDSGKSDIEHQICYYGTVAPACPTGYKQVALISGREAKQQRQYCIPETELKSLSSDASKFWSSGFWPITARQKELASCDLEQHGTCPITVKCFPVDHSIPGACAWGIETISGWVVYTGDLRLHGKRGALTDEFVEEAAKLHPRVLIIEGTNITRESNISEQDVHENALKAISGVKGLVIADFPARDMDRLLTFLQIAKETGRRLAILPKDAYLLKALSLVEKGIPYIALEQNLVIYQDTTSSPYPAVWLRNLYQEYDGKVVLAEDVRKSQDEYILSFSFYDINELPSIYPKEGSLYLYSSSEPHDEEQEIDFRRLDNWLKHFGIQSLGLPRESNNGWQIPEDERGFHASGHACGKDLIDVCLKINPQIVIPVHSEHPETYVQKLDGSGISVVLPSLQKLVTA